MGLSMDPEAGEIAVGTNLNSHVFVHPTNSLRLRDPLCHYAKGQGRAVRHPPSHARHAKPWRTPTCRRSQQTDDIWYLGARPPTTTAVQQC